MYDRIFRKLQNQSEESGELDEDLMTLIAAFMGVLSNDLMKPEVTAKIDPGTHLSFLSSCGNEREFFRLFREIVCSENATGQQIYRALGTAIGGINSGTLQPPNLFDEVTNIVAEAHGQVYVDGLIARLTEANITLQSAL